MEITLLTPFVWLDLDHARCLFRGIESERSDWGRYARTGSSKYVGVDYIEAVGRGLVSTAASHDHKDR